MKSHSEFNETSTKLGNESDIAANVSVSIDNIQFRLTSAQKVLANKDEILRIQEENLKLSNARVIELTRCVNALQIDRDTKAIEVLNLQHAIELHVNTINELQSERQEVHGNPIDVEGSMGGEFIYHQLESQRDTYINEINKYEDTIKSLKFDLDVMESLYRSCNDEMIKQEKTIDLLRDAYFVYYFKEFNLQLENEILQSSLKQKNKSLDNCRNVLYELNQLKKEISLSIDRVPETQHPKCETEKMGIIDDMKNEFDEMSAQLYALQNVLICQTGVEKLVPKNDDNIEKTKKSTFLKNKVARLKKKLKYFEKKLLSSKISIGILTQKLKNSKGNLKHKRIQIHDLKKKSIQKDKINEVMMKKLENWNATHEKNANLTEENRSLQSEVQKSKILLRECEEANLNISIQLMALQKKYHNLENKYKSKNDSVTWLELELDEASAAGCQLCMESEEVFTQIRKWLSVIKEERRFLLAKLMEFERQHQLLTL